MAELTTLARPYAKAAFEFAFADKNLSGWSKALKLLVEVAAEKSVQLMFDSPSMTAEQKASALAGVCGDKLDDKQKNFVSVLADNGRLSLLPELYELFELFKAQAESTVDVTLETAYDIDAKQLSELEGALKKNLARDVICQTKLNKDLLGGVVIRAGDTVIDASVRGRLSKLATAMNA